MKNTKNVILILFIAIICCLGYIQYTFNKSTNSNFDSLSNYMGRDSRVINLPEDGNAFHLSLFLNNDYMQKKDRQIVAWFETNNTLRSVKAQSHFHIYTPDDEVYRARFASDIPSLPCIMFQDSTGKVYYKATNPQSQEQVVSAFATLFDKKPWRRVRPWLRPKPGPGPGPGPGPNPSPGPEPIDTPPNIGPIPDTPIPDSQEFPWLLFFIIVGGAGGTMALFQWYTRTH